MDRLKKKGTATYVVGLLVRMFLVLIPIFIVVVFLKAEAINVLMSTHNLENSILFNRVFYSRNSIFAIDEDTGRVQFGVVDMNKFNRETLEKLFDSPEDSFGFKFVLTSEGMEEVILYFNENNYKYVEARYGAIYGSSRKVNIISGTIPVKIVDGKNARQGYLTVSEGFWVKK